MDAHKCGKWRARAWPLLRRRRQATQPAAKRMEAQPAEKQRIAAPYAECRPPSAPQCAGAGGSNLLHYTVLATLQSMVWR